MPALEGVHKIIAETATAHGIEPALALAIAEAESNFQTWASRYESTFRWINERAQRPRDCTLPTELQHQKTSWGLMQVMGIVARELGHKGWISELQQPEIGALYGCKHLARKFKAYGSQGLEAVISSYNAGRPDDSNYKSYVVKVMTKLNKWREAL